MKILKGMNDIAVHQVCDLSCFFTSFSYAFSWSKACTFFVNMQHLEDPFEDGNGILTQRKGVTYGLEDARQALVTYWATTYKAKRASLLLDIECWFPRELDYGLYVFVVHAKILFNFIYVLNGRRKNNLVFKLFFKTRYLFIDICLM